jgi:hypothetical protein
VQNAGDNFAAAVASHRTWMPVRLRADWRLDGYDGDGTIDDLSGQVGAEWSADHDLDDGYPSTVSFVSGSAVPELEAELGGRTVAGVPTTAAAYWSPLRTDSPVYGLERDLADVTFDVGLVTASGPQYVRVFTGQMVNTPVKGGKATLKTLSATRIALMGEVQPPAFPAKFAGGLRASWPVSWCLWQRGISAGPKVRDSSTTLYHPNHGSLWRFFGGGYPGGNALTTSGIGAEKWYVVEATPATAALGGTIVNDAGWIPGPYVAAPDLQLQSTLSRRAYVTPPVFDQTEGQPDALSQAGNRGRLEAWVKGDPATVNTAPGGSGGVSALLKLQMVNTSGSGSAQLGVDTQRRVYVQVWDGTAVRTLTGATVPSDGAWHFVGAAYDFFFDKLWTCMDNTVSSASAALVTSLLPASGNRFADPSSYILSYLPFSDFTFSTGADANPDSSPAWRNDDTFAPNATVRLSSNRLLAIAEPKPREAWELIGSYAQAELAAMRCDELDRFLYLTQGHWVLPAQQAVASLEVSSARNAGGFDVDNDPSRIRNSISVSYSEASIPEYSSTAGTFRRVFELGTDQEVAIPPGATDLRVTMSSPIAALGQVIYAADGSSAPVTGAGTSYATYNLAADGSGSYNLTSVTCTVTAWDAGQVTLRFINTSTFTYFLANGVNVPALALAGLPVTQTQTYVTETDTSPVSLVRGERSLSVSSTSGVQTRETARRLARMVKTGLRLPMTTVGDDSSGVTVMADPRRQPGDLTEFVDTETGASGELWRLQSVRHRGRGAEYTQEVVARRVFPICVVGQGLVGRSLVGPLT